MEKSKTLDPFKYILYDGRIYQAQENKGIDSNANWLRAENDGAQTEPEQGVALYHPDDRKITKHGYSQNAVMATYGELIFIRESEKEKYAEYFI